MGIFSGKTEITVAANTLPLIESSPDNLSDAVIHAVLSGTPIVSNILNSASQGIYSKIDRFHNYAENSYSLGLPEVEYQSSLLVSQRDVIDAIIADTGNSNGVALDFHYICLMTAEHTIIPYLLVTRGWNPETNEITIPPTQYVNNTVTNQYFEISLYETYINDDGTTVTIKYKIRPYTVEIEVDEEENKSLVFVYQSDEYFEEIQSVPDGIHFGRDYCIASYYPLDGAGNPSEITHWWYYDISSNLYSGFTPSSSIDEDNNLLPVIPIRYQNESMTRTEVQGTDLYLTSKELLNLIGIDIHEISDTLEENPDIDEIDHAYIAFGVDLQSDNVEDIRYLAEFFDHISDKATADVFSSIHSKLVTVRTTSSGLFKKIETQNVYKLKSGIAMPTSNSQSVISVTNPDGDDISLTVTGNSTLGSFTEYGLDIGINYEYIRSAILPGTIEDGAKVGHAIKEWIEGNKKTDYLTGGIGNLSVYDASTLILKVQLTETTYKKVTVQGLVHINRIYKGLALKNHSVITSLTDVITDEDEHNFIIPIHYNLLKELPFFIAESVIQNSMVLIMNSEVKTHVNWYERGAFKVLLTAVGAVITIASGGAGAWVGALATAATAGVGAFTMFILESVIIALSISVALNYVAEFVGPEIMLILSVATIALASLAQTGLLEGILNLTSSMPTASDLLGLSSQMLSAGNNVMEIELEKVYQEYEEYQGYKESKLSELDDALELITSNVGDGLNLIPALSYSQKLQQPVVNSPTEFYDLAIHTGNIGVISLDSISTFFDLALKLPESENSYV